MRSKASGTGVKATIIQPCTLSFPEKGYISLCPGRGAETDRFFVFCFFLQGYVFLHLHINVIIVLFEAFGPHVYLVRKRQRRE